LAIDPNRLVHVHSRFPGEVVAIGQRSEDARSRPLRYGDRVARGDLLATLWSKEIGEKKSELVDAISRLVIDQEVLQKLESVTVGVVSQRQIMETRRKVDEDLVDVARIERTLRSWRLSDDEVEAVKRESPARRQAEAERPTCSARCAFGMRASVRRIRRILRSVSSMCRICEITAEYASSGLIFAESAPLSPEHDSFRRYPWRPGGWSVACM
jgi:cobalt-zinc-cadmium efflux system membrane fusion protein